jgi:hypothetical protein
MAKFDIIEYISGMTPYVFSDSVLKRISADREVMYVESYSELTQESKDLIKADLLYEAYLSPSVMASCSQSHGSYTNAIGSQQTYEVHRERLYNVFVSIYRKYEDPKLEFISNEGTLQWL